jgi:hypothetical protein
MLMRKPHGGSGSIMYVSVLFLYGDAHTERFNRKSIEANLSTMIIKRQSRKKRKMIPVGELSIERKMLVAA